jgi:hypothetical protein
MVLPVFLVISGCVTFQWPHNKQVVPTVRGTVTRNGAPVAGATVSVLPMMHANSCAASRYSAVTDESGRFAIDGDKRLDWFPAIGEGQNSWGICIGESSAFREGWRSYGVSVPPHSVEVTCDLGVKPADGNLGYGICYWKKGSR